MKHESIVYISDIPLADVWRFMGDIPLGAVALGGGLCPWGHPLYWRGKLKTDQGIVLLIQSAVLVTFHAYSFKVDLFYSIGISP